ncbi:DUF3298 and DUF4163 domain-containing protein [Clostridium thermarum]|uniref:DUF3298 and DUF4163 domain-containing protein n=1 Tax=Clostridium thermarum TaxID=1716543 RepID=UPI0013D0105E|nr:DUF3298 and DUF4163 domain-containing protein [Clostridium thermarum]
MFYYDYYRHICPYGTELYRMDSPNNPINVVTKNIKTSNEKIKVELRIPIIQGSITPNILKHINSNFENDIMEFNSQMEQAADENAQAAKAANKKIDPYRISNIYAVTYNKNNIISVSLIYEQYINGRSYYIRTTYNYDINTGKSLSVADLFKPGVNGKALINTEIVKELGTNPQNYFPGAIQSFKGIADDQPFYIDGQDLVLFFRFNEIAPVASEIPVIRIPLSRFGDSIKPQLLRGGSFSE